MEVAASKGLPVLKYHLLPRTKGFTTAVQCLRGTGKSHPLGLSPARAPSKARREISDLPKTRSVSSV